MIDVTVAVAVAIPCAAAWHLGYLWLSEKRVSRQLRLNEYEAQLTDVHKRLDECDVAFKECVAQTQEAVTVLHRKLTAEAVLPPGHQYKNKTGHGMF